MIRSGQKEWGRNKPSCEEWKAHDLFGKQEVLGYMSRPGYGGSLFRALVGGKPGR